MLHYKLKLNQIFFLSVIFLIAINGQAIAQNFQKSALIPESKKGKINAQADVTYLSNSSGNTVIEFYVFPGDSPLEIRDVEWVKRDTIYKPLKPYRETLDNLSKGGEEIYWTLRLTFPYVVEFGVEDFIRIDTDKGILRFPTSMEGKYKESIKKIKLQNQQLEGEASELRSLIAKYKPAFIVFLIISCILAAGLIICILSFRHRFKKIELNHRESSLNHQMLDNEYKDKIKNIENIFRNQYEGVNRLADEYYEKKDSESLRLSLYNVFEKYINSYKETTKVEELQENLNLFFDNVIKKLKEQVTDLSPADIDFLTYLYSGFSPRAVCVLTDNNMKHYYYRRNKLKDIIEASDAPGKNLFLSLLK